MEAASGIKAASRSGSETIGRNPGDYPCAARAFSASTATSVRYSSCSTMV